MKVSKQELEAVTALSPEERYGYFVKRICDWEQVWVLFEDDCIVLNEAKNGKLYVLLFPFEDFASHYATNTQGMQTASYRSFDIHKFVETIMKKLQANNVSNALVFPVPHGYGLNVTMEEIVEDIKNELKNYE